MTVTITDIKRAVAAEYGLPVRTLTSRMRLHKLARPRMVAMCLARELTGLSYPAIGKSFGNKDHSTVISACRRVRAGLLRDDKERLASLLRAQPNWRAKVCREICAANVIAVALIGFGGKP